MKFPCKGHKTSLIIIKTRFLLYASVLYTSQCTIHSSVDEFRLYWHLNHAKKMYDVHIWIHVFQFHFKSGSG
jgi:hypothetical protein